MLQCYIIFDFVYTFVDVKKSGSKRLFSKCIQCYNYFLLTIKHKVYKGKIRYTRYIRVYIGNLCYFVYIGLEMGIVDASNVSGKDEEK